MRNVKFREGDSTAQHFVCLICVSRSAGGVSLLAAILGSFLACASLDQRAASGLLKSGSFRARCLLPTFCQTRQKIGLSGLFFY